MELFLSKSTMPIVRYVAILLGWLMNGIFEVLDRIGIPNIGIAIIFFTIIIYMLMLPIQISQQKSSKLMSVIQPEMQKIQKKYEGKRDQASQMKMQEELSTLYSRYGYSPTGTCLPLLVQMPLLFGLYQVILYIPGYVTKVGAIFTDVASKIVSVSGYDEIIRTFVSDNRVRVALGNEITTEKVIDFLYALKPSQWLKLQDISQFSGFSSEIADTAARSERINSFLTINISDSPWDAVMSSINSIRSGSASGVVILTLIIAVMIPFLAWFTQWLNMKLMPQASTQDDKANAMTQQMQTMNTVMPIFSAFMCATFSMGIGIYWIVGAVVRCVQQVTINRKIGKIDPQQIAEEAKEKQAKKLEKKKESGKNYTPGRSITQSARVNMKKIESNYDSAAEAEEQEMPTAPSNSITAKANLVKKYDEKNRRKK